MSHLRRVDTAWARVALPRGSECHVASTWPRANKPPFFSYFKIIFNIKNYKINSEKSGKIPKN